MRSGRKGSTGRRGKRLATHAAAVAAVLAVAGGVALHGETLTLAEALRRAREGGREVVAAAASQRAAEADLRQARGARWPTLQAQELWDRTDSPAESFAFLLNQERFSFPQFVASDPNDPEPLTTAMTRLELALPLYTGGEISGRIEQAGLAAAAAAERTRWAEESAALAAGEAWVMLAQARDGVALLERARATVAAHVDFARAWVEQGMLVRSELLRAEVELARLDDLLAEARGGARVAAANLAFALAAPADSDYELPPLAIPASVAPLAEWLDAAGARPDLAAAEKLLAAARLEADVRGATRLPRVGLVARQDWYDDTLFGGHGDATTVMAMASIELFAGGRHRAAIAAAQARADAGAADVARYVEGIRLEVRQAWEQATTALGRSATARRAVAAAVEGERITGERFRAGVARTLDLLDAESARRDAETRELGARAEAQKSLLRLAVRSGRPADAALLPAEAASTPAASLSQPPPPQGGRP